MFLILPRCLPKLLHLEEFWGKYLISGCLSISGSLSSLRKNIIVVDNKIDFISRAS